MSKYLWILQDNISSGFPDCWNSIAMPASHFLFNRIWFSLFLHDKLFFALFFPEKYDKFYYTIWSYMFLPDSVALYFLSHSFSMFLFSDCWQTGSNRVHPLPSLVAYGVKAPSDVPVFAVGHSCGALLQLLVESYHPDVVWSPTAPTAKNGTESQYNRSAVKKINILDAESLFNSKKQIQNFS